MSLCVAIGGKVVTLAATAFTIAWTHSVERTEWQEDWMLTRDGLVITEARVKGSGAGMDPGHGARLEDGWWAWKPDLPTIPKLTLAASGRTTSGWRLCYTGGCMALGEGSGPPVVVKACEP